MTLGDLARRAQGTLLNADPEQEFAGFALDSNSVRPGDLFVAIRGQRVDGHQFCQGAIAVGAAACLVEEEQAGLPQIVIENTVDALAQLAATFREGFEGPVIGVTGSVGKTTAKEFIACALSPLGAILKTEGNRNTEYTAPLLWTELNPSHRAVVVEMAMRGFGQIAHLASFSKPTIGIVTNIGLSHIELVGSQDGVAKAKAELLQTLPPDGVAVAWHEDPYLPSLRLSSAAKRFETFGFSEQASSKITSYQPVSWTVIHLEGETLGEKWSLTLPMAGRHMALNAALALLVARLGGVPLSDAAKSLESVRLPGMRMEIREVDGVTYVVDAYNASPSSMQAALETLAELPCPGRKIAVLGDMKELGEESERLHRELGEFVNTLKLDQTIYFGAQMAHAQKQTLNSILTENHEQIASILQTLQQGDTVLIKGSRSMELEKVLGGIERCSR